MVLEAIGAAMVAGLTPGNWDAAGAATGVWATAKGASVDQAFQKKLAAIDYRIQMQQLQREDIRDLVDLTVGRMDMYHVVGTLLLTFVVGWYTDNAILEKKLPTWYIALFFISNFAAVGYLVLSVWLAMHASIVSQSIGVRLLTSYARLSIPSRTELNKIRVPVLAHIENFLDKVPKFLGFKANEDVDAIPNDENAGDAEGRDQALPRSSLEIASDSTSRRLLGSFAAAPRSFSGGNLAHLSPPRLQPLVNEDEDDTRRHFRRFLFEQRKWLSYDAYARLCMSFGMNMVLQSLAYYVMGVVYQVSRTAAVTSFFAIKLLALLLLRLDIERDGNRTWGDILIFFVLHVLPPGLAALLLNAPHVLHASETLKYIDVTLACPCYLLHAGWLVYLAQVVQKGTLPAATGSHAVRSKRLRVACYLNVLDPEQVKTVEALKAEEEQERIDAVNKALESLERMMKDATETESTGTVDMDVRQSEAFIQATEELKNRVGIARRTETKDPSIESKLHLAEQVLDYVAIWSKAPEIFDGLSSLQSEDVQSALPDEHKIAIEAAYIALVHKCRELGVNLQKFEEEQPRSFLRLDLPDSADVKINEDPDICIAQSVRKESKAQEGAALQRSDTISFFREGPGKATSFCTALGAEFPRWLNRARKYMEEQNRGSSSVGRRVVVEKALSTLVPEDAAPDEQLPGVLVRILTLATAFWWFCAAFAVPLWQMAAPRHSDLALATLNFQGQLATSWPSSAGFLYVNTLSCNDSMILAGTEFSMLSGKKLRDGTVEFTDTYMWPSSDENSASATLFGASSVGSCEVLSPAASSWVLSPLGSEDLEGGSPVPVPPSWRRVTAWTGSCTALPCNEIQLAGWDGVGVVVAALKQNGANGRWSVQPRFRVQPGRGRCAGDDATCQVVKSQDKYDNVTSLQFGPTGRTMSVLLGDGTLDAWDLPSSTLLQRWRLSSVYAAMCHHGQQLVFVRATADGPVLEEYELPGELSQIHHEDDSRLQMHS